MKHFKLFFIAGFVIVGLARDLPTHKYGQSYGLGQIHHAIDTRPLLLPLVEQKVQETFGQAEKFVQFCNEYFKK